MKKISLLLLFFIIINIFSSMIIYAEENNNYKVKLLNNRIDFVAGELNITEKDIDKYLSEYDRAEDFLYDLIKYKKYLENNNEEISFNEFINKENKAEEEAASYTAAQTDLSDVIFMPPEQELNDYRNNKKINNNERIDYSLGVLSYEETEFVLPE